MQKIAAYLLERREGLEHPERRDQAHTGTMKEVDLRGPSVEELLSRYLKHGVTFGDLCKGTSHAWPVDTD